MPPENDSRWVFLEGQDLALNIESGIYYATKAFGHLHIRNLFKTTKQTDIRKAKRELPRLIKEHLDEHLEGRRVSGKGRTVADVVDEVLDLKALKFRLGTQENRAMYFGELRRELGAMPIDKITLPYWSAWLEKFRKRKDRGTFWDYAKHMNILIRYAYEQKYITHRIMLPNPDPKKTTGTVISPKDLGLLFDAMNDMTRDQFVLCYENCMRLREALHLTWDRIDLETGELTLRPEDVKTGSKTNKGRTFFVTENALSRLRNRRTIVPASCPWVFPSRTGKGPVEWNATAWKRAKEQALKKNPQFPHWARWHDLRHSSLSRRIVDLKQSVAEVSLMAGVSMQTIERIYLHSTAEKTRVVSQDLRISDLK